MSEFAPAGVGGVLGREELALLIQSERPLISEYRSLAEQLQPNGFDLSLSAIARFDGQATLGSANAERSLPETESLAFDANGWIDLTPGPYQVVFNEVVDLPNDLMALGRPRSSLCRGGATMHTAVWDAGYRGRSTALLVVENPAGLRLARDARLMQLVFFTLTKQTARGYDGAYQGENLETRSTVGSRD